MLVRTTRKEAIHMSASVYTRYAYVGGGYVTIITVDGKEYKGTGKTEAASVIAAQAAVQAGK
jgi:hypothetical protein